MIAFRPRGITAIAGDRKAGVAVMASILLSSFVGVTGTVIDISHVIYAKKMLQTATDSAALAGAQDINSATLPAGTAITTATTYSATSGNKNAQAHYAASMASGYPQLKCLTSTGVSCTGSDSANAIVVKQTAEVPLYFASLFGFSVKSITATATAGAKGAGATLLDIMIVLDTTASMKSSDTTCGSGATRISCAEEGIQSLLTGLLPGTTANPVTQVGLMAFPPLASPSQAQYDYDCSGTTNPATAHYSAVTSVANSYESSTTVSSPTYLVLPLANDYLTSAATPTLNTSSSLVRAAGGGGASCTGGIQAPGGSGTFFADAVLAAKSYLSAKGRSNSTKVIIVMSDGDANSSYAPNTDVFSPTIPLNDTTRQCNNAITAANSATNAGMLVYTIAYGAPTSGCSTDTGSSAISPCDTLKHMASDYATNGSNSVMFYSNTAGATGSSACNAIAANTTAGGLTTIFRAIQHSVNALDGASPRLLSDSSL